jgi:S1-C subfamily serine protease
MLCAWCSFLSGLGGWIMGQDLARREEQAKYATASTLRQDLPPLGVLVVRLEHSGPAAQAGVDTGDTIVAVNGVHVESPRDLRDQLQRYRPNDVVRLTVVRDRETDLPVRLGAVPGESSRPYLGVYFTARAEEPADI